MASVTLKTATRVFGFFSTIRASILMPASAVPAPMGTTAPFSAMSGPVIVTSLLSLRLPLPPRAFRASCTDLASKAFLLNAWAGVVNTAPEPSAPAVARPCLSASRRVCMESLLGKQMLGTGAHAPARGNPSTLRARCQPVGNGPGFRLGDRLRRHGNLAPGAAATGLDLTGQVIRLPGVAFCDVLPARADQLAVGCMAGKAVVLLHQRGGRKRCGCRG